jgi:oligoribonuclease NrnB/cAMP/cGMP phosphodiesterase (DHH superfamily)
MIVIYHANCTDGFMAAVILEKKYPGITLYPGIHGEFPNIKFKKHDEVYFVDFSYKRDMMLNIAKKVHSITVYDHHKTTFEELEDLPKNIYLCLDQTHSGSMITWRECFLDHEIPPILKYIEDHDLWKFNLPFTKEITSWLFSVEYELYSWNNILNMNTIDIDAIILPGRALYYKQMKDIKEIIAVAKYELEIGIWKVPVVNIPYIWASEVAGILCEEKPFAAAYFYNGKNFQFSLRSDKSGIDVSVVAKKYGGGGHEHAAGFKIGDLNEL